MSEIIKKRLERLEERVKLLEKAIPSNLICPACGLLLTIHEDYKCEYLHSSHAQCYRCGTYFSVYKEPNWKEDKRRKLKLK